MSDNVFSKKHGVTKGIRMYATPDGKQRYYGPDTRYFISYNIRMLKDHYTICGASGSTFYSYAVLDMYGATLEAGYCKGEFIQVDKVGDNYYIVVSGLVSDLENLMVLDADKEEVGPNPPYKPCDDDEGGGGGEGASSTTLLAADFVYDGEHTYTINSFVNSYIDEMSDLSDSFVIYVKDVETIVAGAQIGLFGWQFELQHVNGASIENDITHVPSVLPIMFSKSSKKARILYSYSVTSSNGFGMEDAYLVFDEEPQP